MILLTNSSAGVNGLAFCCKVWDDIHLTFGHWIIIIVVVIVIISINKMSLQTISFLIKAYIICNCYCELHCINCYPV